MPVILDEIPPIVLALNSICRTAGFDMVDTRAQFAQSSKLVWGARTVS
jgi:hypothetical protein